MNIIDKTIHKIDTYQQRIPALAFIHAVIKKYGEDEAGQQAALLTYYAFLSLFPLLLVLTTITDGLVGDNTQLGSTIISGLTDYFPTLSGQLTGHVHGLHRSGLALIIGLLFTFYGTRGVADAFRRGIRRIWGIDKKSSLGFPHSLFNSLGLVTVGGVGFIIASVVAGLIGGAHHGITFRVLSLAIDLLILFWLFSFLINIALPRHVTLKETRLGAAVAAVGLVALQTLGGYIITRELKSLDALYSNFAIALGLLFWIYLQAQIFYYSVEIAIVSSQKRWPRSLREVSSPPDA